MKSERSPSTLNIKSANCFGARVRVSNRASQSRRMAGSGTVRRCLWHTVCVRTSAAEDTLAIGVYRQAEATGEPITLGMVERRLDELRGHDPSCTCGLCTAAAAARASGVWYVVRGWAGGIAATRRRAGR